jgi:hypothetical protein
MLPESSRRFLLKTAYDLNASLERITPRNTHLRPVLALCAEYLPNIPLSDFWFWKSRSNAKTYFDCLVAYLADQFPTDNKYVMFKSLLIPLALQKDTPALFEFVERGIREQFKMRRAGDLGAPCPCGDRTCVQPIQILAVGNKVYNLLMSSNMTSDKFKIFCHGYWCNQEPDSMLPLQSPHISIKHEILPLIDPGSLDFFDIVANEAFEKALAKVTTI